MLKFIRIIAWHIIILNRIWESNHPIVCQQYPASQTPIHISLGKCIQENITRILNTLDWFCYLSRQYKLYNLTLIDLRVSRSSSETIYCDNFDTIFHFHLWMLISDALILYNNGKYCSLSYTSHIYCTMAHPNKNNITEMHIIM